MSQCTVEYNVSEITEYVLSTLGERCQSAGIVIPTVIIYGTIFLLGLFGNICTCIVIAANKSMHNPTNYYLFSLAVSDIIALILGLPMEFYQSLDYSYPYRFSEGICKARAFLIEFTSYASIMIICCFSFERWLAICHPLRSKIFSTLWRANVLIILAWTISFVCALPIAFIVQINKLPLPEDAKYQPWTNKVSTDGIFVLHTEFCAMNQSRPDQQKMIIIFAFTVFFVIPAIAIVIMYAHIAVQLESSEIDLKGDKMVKKRRNKSNRTVLKMLLSVVITFFICWLPFHIQRLLSVYTTWSETTTISPPVQFLSMIVFYISGFCYYSNSAANPILYNILSQKYRSAFCRTILGDHIANFVFKGHQRPGQSKRCSSSTEAEQRTLMTRGSVRVDKPHRKLEVHNY
ncbi:Neuromedin U receptor homolog nmur-2 [Caenorhabditis elegans]|uniref:Neuromedin U receptor homolog nmur-2 n=1 Tax=Caenorhabditis elegans TaxID=6239 RepID=NMUR2_CAEEL|nr:Neuromedin U receptor homolog nmur-2 [Caenorhabditis elegans]CCD67735.1 Neuromedin U receptor homolog nmur-2 [Caenorhabditis elegans]|eukprot:NP_493666.2 NMUR (NeuroMedin U Receptor) homolog [Caenorhabditis elegans]